MANVIWAQPGARCSVSYTANVYCAIREIAVKPLQPELGSQVCLAYAAPAPKSELYAPYLVLVSRLIARAGKLPSGQDAMMP